MNQKLGMDTGTARAKRDAMQLQINALTAIATDLSATYTAAQYPQAYGIESGEKTIAPWSMSSLNSARSQIQGARTAASGLLLRIGGEALSQDLASAGDAVTGTYGFLREVSWWRRFVSWPRTLLELPAALRMLGVQGRSAWATGLNVKNWWLRGTSAGSGALRDFTRTSQTPYWLRSTYTAGNNLKIQNLVNPAYSGTPSLGRHARPPAWTTALNINRTGIVARLGTTMTVVGKGFGVLGAIGGAANLATGITGLMDGDPTSEDVWSTVDGAVGLVTSIGSLAPPPVGLVFAGAGLAYTAGRWLFGSDENGQTGLDHIGNAASNTVEFVGDVAENVGNFVKDLWPPW